MRIAGSDRVPAAISKQFSRFGEIATAQIFEHDRQIVGQFPGRQLEAAALIQFYQFDHGVAALAAVAMQVLEQVERSAASSIEQIDVSLLRCEQLAVGEYVDQREQAFSLAFRDERR